MLRTIMFYTILGQEKEFCPKDFSCLQLPLNSFQYTKFQHPKICSCVLNLTKFQYELDLPICILTVVALNNAGASSTCLLKNIF